MSEVKFSFGYTDGLGHVLVLFSITNQFLFNELKIYVYQDHIQEGMSVHCGGT